MKVMLDHFNGSHSIVSRGNATMKHTTAVPNNNINKGCSNEDIYNAIMSFKHKITNLFANDKQIQNKKLDTIA